MSSDLNAVLPSLEPPSSVPLATPTVTPSLQDRFLFKLERVESSQILWRSCQHRLLAGIPSPVPFDDRTNAAGRYRSASAIRGHDRRS